MGMQRLRGQEEAADGTGLIPLRSWPRDPQGLETPDSRVTGWEEMGRGHDLPTGPSAGGRQRGGSCQTLEGPMVMPPCHPTGWL